MAEIVGIEPILLIVTGFVLNLYNYGAKKGATIILCFPLV